MATTSRSADLTSGPMLQKIILFSVPLAASSILQLLFNAADVVVVGRFAGSTALAAVGSNGALINLLVNLFVGLSLGANVVEICKEACKAAKAHEGAKLLPDCVGCHGQHPLPPQKDYKFKEPTVSPCYGCHHMENFQRCSASGCHEK